MFVSVKVYYQKCPTCKQTWSTQLSQAEAIRIGQETFTCKCGTAWPTGRVEWANLTPRQRRSYFLSTAEIGVLILWPFVGGLFAFFIARNKWMGLLWGILGGLLVAFVFVAVMWGLKFCFVKLSLRRCPPDRLATPVGLGFFDLLRDPVAANPLEASPVEPGSSLGAQLRDIRPISWFWLGLAALGWIRVEYTWPLIFVGLIGFIRSLRKLRSDAAPAREHSKSTLWFFWRQSK